MHKVLFNIVVCLFALIICHVTKADDNTWTFLKKGDKIDVIWPSTLPIVKAGHKTSELYDNIKSIVEKYELHIDFHTEYLDSKGYEDGFYYANNTEKRADLFKDVILKGKAAWAGCGGPGAIEVVYSLKDFGFPKRKIPVIGYSNSTNLHLLCAKNKWPSLYAIFVNFNKEASEIAELLLNFKSSVSNLMEILTGKIKTIEYEVRIVNPFLLNDFKKIEKTYIIGGYLKAISQNVGTPTALNANKAIVFFESNNYENEPPSRLEEDLIAMIRQNVFDGAVAILVGYVPIKGDKPALDEALKKFSNLLEKKQGKPIPILQSDNFGHGAINDPLPLGTVTELNFINNNKAKLKISTNESAYAK